MVMMGTCVSQLEQNSKLEAMFMLRAFLNCFMFFTTSSSSFDSDDAENTVDLEIARSSPKPTENSSAVHQNHKKKHYSHIIMGKLSTTLLGKFKNRKESSWPLTKCFDHINRRDSGMGIAQNWNVEFSHLFIGYKFSHGAHSQIYHGIYKARHVAIKIFKVPECEEKKTIRSLLETQFSREVTHLPRLHHQNVVSFIAAYKDTNSFCILTEYQQKGSLRAHLNKFESKPIPLENVLAFALDIARGMEYIHAQGIIHRDLKPENILVDWDSHLKIADFGIACEASKCDSLWGTYRWMAPEMIKGKCYGRKVDVYSFGLILWEMVSGTVPFQNMTPIQVAVAVADRDSRPIIPTHCPHDLRDLINQCWALNPDERLEFCQIVRVLEQLIGDVYL
ncbi:unnamed protein product [Sphenostylis stenocarpa]|uniref:Protein kinase domain-containing protein n=1 Tax=Sphenostylis stenocarpa TaxID=92480 RepID=A0AA86SNY8_9FABA|nr:unnamed protein product [Sphenostylis stenocarpa]